MPRNYLLSLLAVCFGAVGVAACIALALLSWSLASRLTNVNDSAFEAIDKALAAVIDRTLDAGQFVQESKLTAETIGESLRKRTVDKAAEQLSSSLELEEKTENLLSGLVQADHGLEVAAASMEVLQNALELGGSLGMPLDGSLVSAFAERIAVMRTKLQETTDTVGRIGEGVAELTDGDAQEERGQQVVQLALRVALTLGEVDSRINSAANALSETQINAGELRARMHSRIVFGEIAILLLIAWMAAGQVSLFRKGLIDYRLVRSES